MAFVALLALLAGVDGIQQPPPRFRTRECTVLVHITEDVRRICYQHPGSNACAAGTVIVMPPPEGHDRIIYGWLFEHEAAHACERWKHETK